jgi:hypothetical protein
MKTDLIEKLKKLPAPLQKEVENFVDFLVYKNQQKQADNNGLYTNDDDKENVNFLKEPDVEKLKLKREAGLLKGKIWMSDDFDEPLEEFPDQKKLSENFTIPKSGFGSGKGIFGKMSDDFDEPLDEMKEYM